MLIRPGTLQFSDYLKQLPPAWCIEHLFTEKDATRKILSSAMIEDCARRFADPAGLRRRFLSLDAQQRLRCALIYLMGSMGCAAEADCCGLDDPVVAAFLGYAATDREGRMRVFGFDGFEPLLRKMLVPVIVDAAACIEEGAVLPICPWRSCNDITLVVSLAAQRLLIRKQSGKPGKAALQIIKKLVHSGEMHKSEDIESIAGLIIGYALSRQLLREEELEYCFRPAAVAEWLALPIEKRVHDIVAFCTSRFSGWNIELLGQVCEAAGARWITDAVFAQDDRACVREALLVLQFAGIIEVRKRGAELLLQRAPQAVFSPSAAAHHAAVVMPDFTVVLPQESLPETLHIFARFCRVHSLDRVYRMSIEKGVLTEALSGGLEGERIIASLKQWKAPVNVIESAREWIREFHRLSLSTESLLITADAKVTEQIASYGSLLPLLERIPAHSVFRIRHGSEKTVRDIVRKLGFDERMPGIMGPEGGDPVPTEGVSEIPEEPRWSLVVDNEPMGEKTAPAIRGSKYGAELKTLELSETIQVIDYAILTSQRLVISYEGSPYVRQGMYTLTPVVCSKGPEPMLDGELQRTGSRKQFYVRKIGSIGVVPQ
ncbi:MAG: hypothetical protein JXA18_13025 [Chitinispirillaceae bacterium]|nr:hypothetical protein [Chitinispirillaceae bacterium]